jgi:hypothetical protein
LEPAPKEGHTHPARSGTVILKTKIPVSDAVVAWVEVDGKQSAIWKAGTRSVELTLTAGSHRVAVCSIYLGVGRIAYDNQINILPDARTEIDVGD